MSTELKQRIASEKMTPDTFRTLAKTDDTLSNGFYTKKYRSEALEKLKDKGVEYQDAIDKLLGGRDSLAGFTPTSIDILKVPGMSDVEKEVLAFGLANQMLSMDMAGNMYNKEYKFTDADNNTLNFGIDGYENALTYYWGLATKNGDTFGADNAVKQIMAARGLDYNNEAERNQTLDTLKSDYEHMDKVMIKSDKYREYKGLLKSQMLIAMENMGVDTSEFDEEGAPKPQVTAPPTESQKPGSSIHKTRPSALEWRKANAADALPDEFQFRSTQDRGVKSFEKFTDDNGVTKWRDASGKEYSERDVKSLLEQENSEIGTLPQEQTEFSEQANADALDKGHGGIYQIDELTKVNLDEMSGPEGSERKKWSKQGNAAYQRSVDGNYTVVNPRMFHLLLVAGSLTSDGTMTTVPHVANIAKNPDNTHGVAMDYNSYEYTNAGLTNHREVLRDKYGFTDSEIDEAVKLLAESGMTEDHPIVRLSTDRVGDFVGSLDRKFRATLNHEIIHKELARLLGGSHVLKLATANVLEWQNQILLLLHIYKDLYKTIQRVLMPQQPELFWIQMLMAGKEQPNLCCTNYLLTPVACNL